MEKEIIERYRVFWAHEETDRPVINLHVSNTDASWSNHAPGNPHDRWENLEMRYKWSRFAMENTKYYGEAYATDWVNFGPGALSAMMGSNYVPDENTIWFGRDEVYFPDWSNIDDLHLQKDSRMYNMVVDMTRILTDRNDGSYIVGISDLGGNLDVLASLRGTLELLVDLYDYPEIVLHATEVIDKAWIEYYSLLRGIIKESGQLGHSAWLGPWCETTYYPLQCDFAYMISPDAFAKFVMPSMKRMTDFLDHSIFHLDGQGQIAHLDQLLSISRLDGIQWVPGDGSPPVWDEKWFPMYDKIQAANKCLVLHGVNTVENALLLCDRLSPKGLYLHMNLDTEEEAKGFMAKF